MWGPAGQEHFTVATRAGEDVICSEIPRLLAHDVHCHTPILGVQQSTYPRAATGRVRKTSIMSQRGYYFCSATQWYNLAAVHFCSLCTVFGGRQTALTVAGGREAGDLLAPGPGKFRAPGLAAMIWRGQAFSGQDVADVAAARREDSALAAVVACAGPLGTRAAGAANDLQIEPAGAHQIAQPTRRLAAQLAFMLARGPKRLGGVERHQPDVWASAIDADRVAVDHSDAAGFDRRRGGVVHQREENHREDR